MTSLSLAALIISRTKSSMTGTRYSGPHYTVAERLSARRSRRSYGNSRTTRNPFAMNRTSTSYLKRDIERRYFA